MAYKIDNLFKSDGTELTNDLQATSLAGATYIEHDGRYLWISCEEGIAIYEWWGASSGNEPAWETFDEMIPIPGKKLRLVTYIAVSTTAVTRTTSAPSLREPESQEFGDDDTGKFWAKRTNRQESGKALAPHWIVKCAGKMYVADSAIKSIFEFDIQQHTFIREIAMPVETMSNLGVSGAKLWYVGKEFKDNVPQKLYSLNPLNGVVTTTDIPVRPTQARAWIASGHNGSVYVTNYNNVSVTRFSDATGAVEAVIRVNAEPTHIFCGPDRRIWVSSYAGMLSIIDHDDNGVHNDYTSGIGEKNRAVSIALDPTDTTKFWFVNTDMYWARQDLNTHEQIELTGFPDPQKDPLDAVATGTVTSTNSEGFVIGPATYDVENAPDGRTAKVGDKFEIEDGKVKPAGIEENPKDWEIESDDLKSPQTMLVTQQMTYQDDTLTNRVIKPYMFFLQGGELLGFRMENFLYRVVSATVNGQAAVVGGNQEYFGD